MNFTASGNDWNDGTAAAYQVVCSANPVTQGNFAGATPVAATAKPGVAGTRESLAITPPPGAKFCAVRAVDAAGNIGPIPLAASTNNGGVPVGTPSGGLPNTASDQAPAGAALLALILLATGWRSRRVLWASMRGGGR